MPQSPLEELRVKESPSARFTLGALPSTVEAVYVAQVPDTYHFPFEIKQPLLAPETWTFRLPLPLKGPLVAVGVAPLEVVRVAVAVPVGEAPERLGRYFTPVAGHLDFARGTDASKEPASSVPLTLKKYQISFRAPPEQPR